MDQNKRSEALARMGLKAIMLAFDAHPQLVTISAEEILLRVKPYDATTDEGGESEQAYNERVNTARALLSSMYADGVFKGEQTFGGINSARLSPHVRAQLRMYVEGSLRADNLRQALEVADSGQTYPIDAFLRVARDIGFEP